MEIRDQLFRLVRIQEIAQETRAARALVDGAPARIEQIEGHFRERNAEYVAVKQRFDAWVVMEAPSGHAFCVVPAQRSDFEPHATLWGELGRDD